MPTPYLGPWRDTRDHDVLDAIVDGVVAFPFIGNMPMEIDAVVITNGLLGAHELGLALPEQPGDGAYRRLHAD